MAEDYYQILGVSPQADQAEIKRAFRRLARKYHPDRSRDPAAVERFRLIAQAYHVLGDPNRRRRFDLYGHQWDNPACADGFAGLEEVLGGFRRVFEGLVTVSPGGEGRSRVVPVWGSLAVTLEEAALGSSVRLEMRLPVTCPLCRGRVRGPWHTCPECRGRGTHRRTQGLVALEEPCPSCQGRGRLPRNPCRICNGRGRVERPVETTVEVPAGVHHGQCLRLEPIRQGKERSPLYLRIDLKPHPVFTRRGHDLLRRLEVTSAQARRGAKVHLDTLIDGRVNLTIPPGSREGDRLRLAGLGMPRPDGDRGDLWVELVVRPAGRAPAPAPRPTPLARLPRLYQPDPQTISRLSRRLAATRLGRDRRWNLHRLEDRLELMSRILEGKAGESLSPADAPALMALAAHLRHQAQEPGREVLRYRLDRLVQLILDLAAGRRQPRRRLQTRPLTPQRLPVVSYRRLVQGAGQGLTELFLERYVVGVFRFPHKLILRQRFGRMLGELFAAIEQGLTPGGAVEPVVDLCTARFVENHRVALKSLCLNLARTWGRPVSLYQFESYLAAALAQFYRMLLETPRQEAGVVELPPPLALAARGDRRALPRHPLHLPVTLRPAALAGQSREGLTRDVSLRGLGVSLPPLNQSWVERTVWLYLQATPGERPLRLAGRVLWQAADGDTDPATLLGIHLEPGGDTDPYHQWLQMVAPPQD
jgi:molecular chaperone DnaJ